MTVDQTWRLELTGGPALLGNVGDALLEAMTGRRDGPILDCLRRLHEAVQNASALEYPAGALSHLLLGAKMLSTGSVPYEHFALELRSAWSARPGLHNAVDIGAAPDGESGQLLGLSPLLIAKLYRLVAEANIREELVGGARPLLPVEEGLEALLEATWRR